MEGDSVNIILKTEKDGLGEPAWPVAATLLFLVRPACSSISCMLSQATCLGSGHGNLSQIHESPSLMPGETLEERSLPLLPTLCRLRHSA